MESSFNKSEISSTGELIEKLKKDLLESRKKEALLYEENSDLKTQLAEYHEKLFSHENQNDSLRRIIERTNLENDELLIKLDSISTTSGEKILSLQNQIELLQEENELLRNDLLERNATREDVVEKLKEVSIETRELIENCEKTSEQTKLFQMKSEFLEEELKNMTDQNELLKAEIKQLQKSEFNWVSVVEFANEELKNLETQFSSCIQEKLQLELEIKKLFSENEELKFKNKEKDMFIAKQNQDFTAIKKTVNEYHGEIVRLDSELKDFHVRVSALNENLETINSENLDLTEYTSFRRCLKKFGNKENIEKLLTKLQMLFEIEDLFEKKLAPHVRHLNGDRNDSKQSVDTNSSAISKIKDYLEKALHAIEKLNEKNLRLASDFEDELQAKNDEISTLKELLSHSTLYCQILEQTLKQYKDNAQMDELFEAKTEELITVNKVLMNNYEELSEINRISQLCNEVLFAKCKQLNLCFRIVKINMEKVVTVENYQPKDECEPNFSRNIVNTFTLIEELFNEINEKSIDFSSRRKDFQRLLQEYENISATKDYLKKTIDSMTLEVKCLTSKVECEMADKIREIESLRSEMNSIRTDNRELVSKIKNCNREIVSLSTTNYDLNEKLALSSEVERKCESLKNELETMRNSKNRIDHFSTNNIIAVYKMCGEFKNDISGIRNKVIDIQKEMKETLTKIVQNVCHASVTSQKQNELCAMLTKCSEFRKENENIKQHVNSFRDQLSNEISAMKNCFNNIHGTDMKRTILNLKSICNNLKDINQKRHEDAHLFKINEDLSELSLKIQQVSSGFQELNAKLNLATAENENRKNYVSIHANNLKKLVTELKSIRGNVVRFVNESREEFFDYQNNLSRSIQEAVTNSVAYMEASISLRNNEIIKEMQDMNLELKKRGELISRQNESLDESEKEKTRLSESLTQKNNLIKNLEQIKSDLENTIKEKTSQFETLAKEMSELKIQQNQELDAKNTSLNNLSSVVENLKAELQVKNETIANLEYDISKQREIQDGDVSSMGTFSRTEEVSRLRDVEDSFEERYTKLRCIAIKMKKSIADLNEQLKSEKAEKIVVQSKLTTAIEQAKRTQALQDECDRITDDLELKCKEIKELKKIIAESDKQNEEITNQCKNLSEKMDLSLKNEMAFKNEKKELENKIKDLTSRLENAEKEKTVQEMLKKENEKQIVSLAQKIKENEENVKKTQSELEQAKLEVRKQGALTLEMRDYEKTISDLNEKLKKERNLNEELNEKLKLSTESNVSLVDRIKQLEEQITSYGAANMIADEQILNLNKLIAEQEKSIEEKDFFLKNLKSQLEEEKLKFEKLTIEAAASLSEMNSFKEQSKIKENSLLEKLKSWQEKSTTLEEKLKKKENDFDKLKEDFESYKIRAHNVLQKHKAENNFKNYEEKLKTEISSLTQAVKDLRKRLDDSLVELDKQKTELKLVQTAKEKLQVRMKEVNEALSDKIKDLDAARAELKSYKLKAETLIQCYKTEIENLKINVENQQKEIEDLKNENNKENFSKEAENSNSNNNNNNNSNVSDISNAKNTTDKTSNVVNERKDEKLENNRSHSMVSLEKLLENDTINENGNVIELRKNIKLLENQVNYLTEILNESEKNSARNEQQVASLKNEIRRLEKNIERAPHLQNGEYLKNVLFNFFTFPDGEEKCHLITILKTLLQLTTEETETLSAIAKGYKVDQRRSSSGLGSMLRLW